MADPFHLRRNVVTSVIAFAATIAVTFISYRLVVLHGGLGAVGLWSNLMAWIFLIRLGDVGMANAAVRFAAALDPAEEPEQVRRHIDTAFVLNAALFLLLTAAGWALYAANLRHIVPGSEADVEIARAILPLLFAGFLLQNLSGLALGALRAIHRGYVAAWLSVAGTVLQLVVVVPLVGKIGLAALAWGQIAQYGLMLLGGWGGFLWGMRQITGRTGPLLPVQASLSVLREMLGFSVKAQLANLLNGFFEPFAKILLGRFGGLELLGLFELAYKLIALPRNAVVSGVQASVPALTRLMASDLEAARHLYQRMLRRSLTVTALVLGAVVLASPLVSWLWLGRLEPQFSLFAALLAVGFLCNGLGAPAFVLGMASGRMRGNIQSAVLALGVMPLCLAAAGTAGLDWGMVAGVALGLGAAGLYIKRVNERLLPERSR